MALWGKTDVAADAPNYVAAEDANNVFFVSTEEAGVTSNIAKGLDTPGWNTYTTYVDSDGNTRHRVETLIPMKVAQADAGDDGVEGDTATEDATVADS